MSLVATLLLHQGRLQRVEAALKDRHAVITCSDWDALIAACETQPIRLAIVDYGAGGLTTFDGLRRFKLRHPRVTLVAYVAISLERARDLFDAGRYGVDGLVIADQDDNPRTFRQLVEQAEARSVVGLVRQTIGNVDPIARDAILIAVTRAHQRLSPDVLARTISITRKRLAHALAEAGFPPPQRLLTWARLIVAAYMLEEPYRTADGVSQALGFPSGSAFRNACQRYLGAAPHELRDLGGAGYVMLRLQREIGAS